MKNLMKLGFMATLVGAMLFFTGCGGDEDVIDGPSMVITTTPAADTDGAIALMIGDQLTISVAATAPAGLNVVRIADDNGNSDELTRTDLGLDEGATEGTATFIIEGFDAAGSTVITVTVVDDANGTATEDLNVTISGTPVSAEQVVLLIPPLGTKDSKTFYSTSTNTDYSMNDVLNTSSPVSADIDFGYFYGTANGYSASLVSPVSYPFEYGQSNWGTRNTTLFRETTLTSAGFDAIASEEQIVAEFEVGSNEGDLIKNLAVGDVVAFKTDADKTGGSKFGLIRIDGITGTDGSNGKLDFTVLVQQ